MNPGCRFAQPGANYLPALRAGFARRRRARRLARGERAKRATPGTWPHENRTPIGVRGLRTATLLNFTTSAVRNLDSSGPRPALQSLIPIFSQPLRAPLQLLRRPRWYPKIKFRVALIVPGGIDVSHTLRASFAGFDPYRHTTDLAISGKAAD